MSFCPICPPPNHYCQSAFEIPVSSGNGIKIQVLTYHLLKILRAFGPPKHRSFKYCLHMLIIRLYLPGPQIPRSAYTSHSRKKVEWIRSIPLHWVGIEQENLTQPGHHLFYFQQAPLTTQPCD